MGGLLPIALGVLAFLGGCWFCATRHAPMIQEDVRTRTVEMLNSAGLKISPNAVSVDGRDVTLTGPKGWAVVSDSTRAKVQALEGVRVATVKFVELAPPPKPIVFPVAEVRRVERNLQAFLRGRTISFETARDVIRPDGTAILDKVAAILQKAPTIPVEISGHTDNTGDQEKNRTLSQRRANAVKAYLVSKGVAANRIFAIGFGQEKPVTENKTARGRARNRRIEFHALGSIPGGSVSNQ